MRIQDGAAMKCAQLAMALLAVAALPAWSMPPPIKHMGEKAQPGPVSQRIYPSPMEVSIARDGLVLVIRRAGPPGIEPGRFELALTSTVGARCSAVQCQIADREPHSVAVDGASASWQESGPSNAAVLVSATLRRADRVGLALPPAARTISATLPGGRAQNVLGAGLPVACSSSSGIGPARPPCSSGTPSWARPMRSPRSTASSTDCRRRTSRGARPSSAPPPRGTASSAPPQRATGARPW